MTGFVIIPSKAREMDSSMTVKDHSNRASQVTQALGHNYVGHVNGRI